MHKVTTTLKSGKAENKAKETEIRCLKRKADNAS
jgi:hypothetical protein